MDMRFGTRHVGSFCRTGSVKTKASELSKCNLDLVAVQEARWVEGCSRSADDCTFSYGNGNAKHLLGMLFVCMCIRSAGKI